MKAYVRDDIDLSKEFPPSSEPLSREEWNLLEFEVIDNPCEDFETEEGFNMIIKHPHTGRHIFVCSIDFNFNHR